MKQFAGLQTKILTHYPLVSSVYQYFRVIETKYSKCCVPSLILLYYVMDIHQDYIDSEIGQYGHMRVEDKINDKSRNIKVNMKLVFDDLFLKHKLIWKSYETKLPRVDLQ